MSGALNPSSGRFHVGAGAAAAPFGAPDALLELTNAAADFAYDFGLGFHHRHHASPSTAAATGFGYFSSEAAADGYASLAWDPLAAYHQGHHHQGGPFPGPCDFGPFAIPGAAPRGMGVQRLSAPAAGRAVLPSAPKSAKARRRVATIAQRRAANIRERRRMFNLNSAFDKLRKKVPTFAYEKRLSRIETLRLAIMYIAFMTEVVRGGDPSAAAPYDARLWTPTPLAADPTPRPHPCSRQV